MPITCCVCVSGGGTAHNEVTLTLLSRARRPTWRINRTMTTVCFESAESVSLANKLRFQPLKFVPFESFSSLRCVRTRMMSHAEVCAGISFELRKFAPGSSSSLSGLLVMLVCFSPLPALLSDPDPDSDHDHDLVLELVLVCRCSRSSRTQLRQSSRPKSGQRASPRNLFRPKLLQIAVRREQQQHD